MSQTAENSSASMQRLVFNRKYILRLAVINHAAAVVAVLVTLLFGMVHSLRDLGNAYVQGLIYAYCIGTLCGMILPLMALSFSRRSAPFKVGAIGSAIIVTTTIGCALAGALIVLAGIESATEMLAKFLPVVRFSVLIALVAGFGVFLYESMRCRLEEAKVELRTRQLEEERARQLATEARLSSLESRIHPHFLFNTLNSIASLIHDEPRRAEEIVGRLAALLRFSLDANQRSLVPLEQELKIVRDYLEIEKARFGERLRYSIAVPRELESASVPPLAIESLVENSVKHVIAPRRQGGEIRVSVRMTGGQLEIEVADSGPGFALDSAPPGHGIDNLLARLDVLYDGRAKFQVETSAVRLLLPEAV